LTQEKFLNILADPEQLSSISYEELKTIVLAYPYAHNLRYLLALKARQEGRPDAARTLATAAAYSLDRTRLFLLYAPKIVVPVHEAVLHEVLELKPLEEVQRELEAMVPQKRPETVPLAASVPPPPVSSPTPTVVSTPPPAAPAPPARQNFHSWISQFHPPVLRPPTDKQVQATVVVTGGLVIPAAAPEAPPLPAAPPPPVVRQEEAAPLPEIPAEKGRFAQRLAERSVAENKDLISETLARLLAKQGHREKAIAMYEKLCLVFPERSSTFAAEIELLKK
jgi:hypothetical protein